MREGAGVRQALGCSRCRRAQQGATEGPICEWCRKEIRNALKHKNKGEPHACFRRTLRKIWPRQCHLCAGGLAAPLPHLRLGSGRPAATAAPGRCFEWPSSHLSARLRTRVPVPLSTSCAPSVAINTLAAGTDASRPSFTPTPAYIAAITAPPPSSMSTLTGVPTVLIELPFKCSECSIVVACYNSPPMCVRPWDDLTNGTPAANIAPLAFSLPHSIYRLPAKT